MSKRIKARWASKIMRSKYFVVLTDKEAGMYLEGANPEDMNDQIALAAQVTELKDFSDRLKTLITDHNVILRKLGVRGMKNAITVGRKNTKGKG